MKSIKSRTIKTGRFWKLKQKSGLFKSAIFEFCFMTVAWS